MIYITAGMGGGTGTGAAPVIARTARELGILTVAVVTKPFEFEGKVRMAQAEDGINKLRQTCDAVIVVPNERLLSLSAANKPLEIREAFRAADEILIKGVQSICRLINDESYIHLDFADLSAILRNSGDAHIGVGIASGQNKAMLAAEQAINSPLLETSIAGAKSILLYVAGGYDMGMLDINTIAERVQGEADADANIIFGASINEEMTDSISVTIIATDFNSNAPGVDSGILNAPVKNKATLSGKRVTIGDLEGVEVDLGQLLDDKDRDTGSYDTGTNFDIPDFLR
jgi:cell division protein FtsZ